MKLCRLHYIMTGAVSQHQNSSAIQYIITLVKKPILSCTATEKTNNSGTRKDKKGWRLWGEGGWGVGSVSGGESLISYGETGWKRNKCQEKLFLIEGWGWRNEISAIGPNKKQNRKKKKRQNRGTENERCRITDPMA